MIFLARDRYTDTQMTGAKFYFVRGCSFVNSYLGILFLLANRQLNIEVEGIQGTGPQIIT